MRIKRWCIATRADDGHPPLGGNWSAKMPLPDGRELFEVEVDQGELRDLQEASGVTVLPGLTAPADEAHLGAPLQAWLSALGVTPEAGDTMLNVLRKLRDAQGGNFDVDIPY